MQQFVMSVFVVVCGAAVLGLVALGIRADPDLEKSSCLRMLVHFLQGGEGRVNRGFRQLLHATATAAHNHHQKLAITVCCCPAGCPMSYCIDPGQ
jgi:hypothetical protein